MSQLDAAESETITVAVSADDLQAGDMKNHERHNSRYRCRQSAI